MHADTQTADQLKTAYLAARDLAAKTHTLYLAACPPVPVGLADEDYLAAWDAYDDACHKADLEVGLSAAEALRSEASDALLDWALAGVALDPATGSVFACIAGDIQKARLKPALRKRLIDLALRYEGPRLAA